MLQAVLDPSLPCRAALVLVLGRRWQCQQGQGGCPIQLEGWHSLGVLGVRQSQRDLKAFFALEIKFGPQGLSSR